MYLLKEVPIIGGIKIDKVYTYEKVLIAPFSLKY